jgi:hypothetical protein
VLEHFEKEIDLFKELYESQPNNVGFKNGLAISYEKLGSTYIVLGNWKKALKLLDMDLETFENTLTLVRRAGYIGKDAITENGLLLLEATEILTESEEDWIYTDL